MLYPLPVGNIIRMVAIDPGSNTAGFCCVDYDMETKNFNIVDAQTYKGSVALKTFGDMRELHEERLLRNLGYGSFYRAYLEKYDPSHICSEAPYMGRFAAAFKALTEQITVFRAQAYLWDMTQPFHLYEPSVVKKAMGVKGGSKDKEDMRRALAKRTDVSYDNNLKLSNLDEHSIDSICVAIHHTSRILYGLRLS